MQRKSDYLVMTLCSQGDFLMKSKSIKKHIHMLYYIFNSAPVWSAPD